MLNKITNSSDAKQKNIIGSFYLNNGGLVTNKILFGSIV